MNDATLSVLAEIETFGRENDSRETSRPSRMLNLDPETARIVYLILRGMRRKHVLEIGTSNGYSTIWIAQAMRETGGMVVSVDRSGDKHRLADENLRRAGLRDRVELIAGDATEVVKSLGGSFDAVFFDADRVSAPTQLDLLKSRMEDDIVLLADNTLSHPDEIAGYLRAVSALAGFESTVVPVGKGLSIAHRFG